MIGFNSNGKELKLDRSWRANRPRYRSVKLNLERVAKNKVILMMTKISDE